MVRPLSLSQSYIDATLISPPELTTGGLARDFSFGLTQIPIAQIRFYFRFFSAVK